MEILVRNKTANKWQKVREQNFENEAALQNILYESPEIIPLEKLGENSSKPKLFIKEAGLPGSGNTDLIGVDEDGGITIIECKLATNADIRRKVIGQVLEYAAYLWQMSYEEFDSICSKAEGWGDKRLTDVIRERIGENRESWSEEGFKRKVSSTLEKGDFLLIIAVDALNDELRRTIQFLNSRGEGSPKICALELRQFQTSDIQMLVPELFGPAVLPPPGPMNEEKLILASSEICRQLYFRLRELSKQSPFKASSFTKRGFAFRYLDKGNLLMLYPDYVQMWFGPGYPKGFLDDEKDKKFWSIVSQIEAFKGKMDKKNPEAKVSDETWTQEEVDMFINALKSLVPSV